MKFYTPGSSLGGQPTSYLLEGDIEASSSKDKPIGYYIFFTAICAIRNSLKHSKASRDIIIGLDDHQENLIVKNLPAIQVIETTDQTKWHPGSSEQTMQYLISCYNKAFTGKSLQKIGNYYQTRIPITKG
jgi:hypothetical protein